MIRKVHYTEMFSLTRRPAEAFFAESCIDGVLNFNHFADKWDEFIHGNIGVVLVNESNGESNGLIGGLVTQCFMTGDVIATECFWWVDPVLRGGIAGIRLFKQWETEVRDLGAKRIYVGNLHSVNHDWMQKLYSRLGYKPLETHYVKTV